MAASAVTSDAALDRVLKLVIRDRPDPDHQFVIVRSPPGAGKTRLVEAVATTACFLGLRVGIACPRVEQTLDLARRLKDAYPLQSLQLWLGQHRTLSTDLGAHARLGQRGEFRFGPLAGPVISIATGKKYSYVRNLRFDLLIVDEAYQLSFADFTPLLNLADRFLLVGDPGQLPPLVLIDPEPFLAAPYRVTEAAPDEILRLRPASPVVHLPVTRRLPPDSAGFVQVFYPDLPFRSAVPKQQRRLKLRRAGQPSSPLDPALELLGAGASLVALLLPKRDGSPELVDADVVWVMAEVVSRMLEREITSPSGSPFRARDIACLHPHVAAGNALRRELQARQVPVGKMLLATPEVAQGLERPVVVVGEAVSGQDPSGFDLDPGRLCVSLSRHSHACLLVVREGPDPAQLHHDAGGRPLGFPDRRWQGMMIHRQLWAELDRLGRVIRL